MPTYRPLTTHLLVRPDPDEYVDADPNIRRILNEGLIQLPDQHVGWFRKNAMTGRVLAVGDRCRLGVQVGEHVVYGRFAGAKLRLHDEDLLILDEASLLGTLDDAESH